MEPKVSILVVDDDPQNLIALSSTLERLGQNLVTARSGREAVRLCQTQDFAVVLMDVRLPDMDGYDAAVSIRASARSKDTPIIFQTAFCRDDANVLRAYQLGCADFLCKPLSPEALRSKVAVFVQLAQKIDSLRSARSERSARGPEVWGAASDQVH